METADDPPVGLHNRISAVDQSLTELAKFAHTTGNRYHGKPQSSVKSNAFDPAEFVTIVSSQFFSTFRDSPIYVGDVSTYQGKTS